MKFNIYFIVFVCLHIHFLYAIPTRERRQRNKSAWLKRDSDGTDAFLTDKEKKWAISYQKEADGSKIRGKNYREKLKANPKNSTLDKKEDCSCVEKSSEHLQITTSQQATFDNQLFASIVEELLFGDSDIEDAN